MYIGAPMTTASAASSSAIRAGRSAKARACSSVCSAGSSDPALAFVDGAGCKWSLPNESDWPTQLHNLHEIY